MLDFHQVGLGLFIFFSIVSLILVVSKPVAKEFKATALEWIRTFKAIKEEWHKPLTIEPTGQPSRLLNQTDSKRELDSGSQ